MDRERGDDDLTKNGTIVDPVGPGVTLRPVLEVDMDLKPGSFPNSSNPVNKGASPPAALTGISAPA